MHLQRVLACFCLTFIYCTQGWHDSSTAEKPLNGRSTLFKVSGVENGFSRHQDKLVLRRAVRRRSRGNNLKKMAIRDAKNRNALCLGEFGSY